MTTDFQKIGRMIQQGQVRRVNDREQAREVQGATQIIVGEFLTEGAGESSRVINFPVYFIEKPFIFFTAQLHGADIVQYQFPKHSATVVQLGEEKLDDQRSYFRSANIAVSTEGPSTMKLWIQWMAVGRALVAPLTGDETAESEI